jgi:hypothetical protein
MEMTYQVFVGNIGMVYSGGDETKANETFDKYVEMSRTNYGRAAGESVIVMYRDELIKEYCGTLESTEE